MSGSQPVAGQLEVGDLRGLELFEGLTDAQLQDLVDSGDAVGVVPGEAHFREGELADHWWLLVDGALDLHRRVGPEDTVVARMDLPGRWAGGFRAWDEHGVYLATGVGARPGRLLRLPATVLRDRLRAWFPLGFHLVGGLYSTARSIESTVRQRESLVTLGTLAAGLAHELNNPAAAATRSVDALDQVSGSLMASLRLLAEGEISAEQFRSLDELREQLGVPASGLSGLSGLDRADREEDLAAWLSGHDVADAWALAAALAGAGADVAWCERVADVIEGPPLGPALEWAAGTVSASTLLDQVREATSRISELVSAVRSYTQMDRASRQPVDVVEGLESTLVMLGHTMRGLDVVRDFGADLPALDAFGGELNQVWTNLIDNAVDALDGEGTLRVSAHAEPDALVVEVGDTGAGMTPEVAERAFDAFYTTKDVGSGTGLGLDIARRIVVERHGGTIDIDLRPDETVLRVRLPR